VLISGLDGCVLIGPDVAAVLAPLLRRGLEESTRRNGFRYPSAVWDALDALEASARAHRSPVVSDVVTTTVDAAASGTMAGVQSGEVSVSRAAALIGRSRQAIDGRCRRGSLPYRRDEKGRRWIRLENLEDVGS